MYIKTCCAVGAKALALILLILLLKPLYASNADFDQDGLSDSLELTLKTDPALADTDGDGLADGVEIGKDHSHPLNSNQDSIIDALDADDDGDQLPTVLESKNDTDQDGLADYLDTDSDKDGKSDTEEAGLTYLDSDQDGLDNLFDADVTQGKDQNGDGIDDVLSLASAVTEFSQVILSSIDPLPVPPVQATSLAPSTDLNAANAVLEVEVSEIATLSMEVKLPAQPVTDLTLVNHKSDTDGDGVHDQLEIGLDPKDPVDTDNDEIFDFLDEDDDGDRVPTLVEGEADRDGDGRVNYLDVDESGYFYCATTGRIVSGIKSFKITPSADVVLLADARDGRYRWYPLKPGTYTLQFILPKGLRTVTALEKGRLYVTPANGNLVNIGWSEDISQLGYLARFNDQQLPLWHSSFAIQDGAPPIINQNIPLIGSECDAS